MPAHKDTGMAFSVRDRRFKAVGFLNHEEFTASGKMALARAKSESESPIGGEDERVLRENLAELPTVLQPYTLVTNRRHPRDPNYVSSFVFDGSWWAMVWVPITHEWDSSYLVVCRQT